MRDYNPLHLLKNRNSASFRDSIQFAALKNKDLGKTFDGVSAALLIIDHNHCIRWMNKNAVEWFGSKDIGKRRVCYRTLEYSKDFCEICPTGVTIDHGTHTRYELSIHLNGRQRILEITGLPVFDAGGSVSMVMEVVVDVTEKGIEKKRTDELMAQIEKMAAIGQLAAGVAHELNTPLASISVISEELKDIMNSEDLSESLNNKDTMQEYLRDMHSEIKRCQRIIDDLLNISRKGILQPVESDVDVNEVVLRTVDFVNKCCAYPDTKIITDLSPTLPVAKTDPLRFRQVLFNVMKNAVEALWKIENGIVSVSSSVESGYIRVMIRDNGPGIPLQNLKKVFEPFFTTKQPGEGTGLGLFVSYNIMRELNGDIEIRSNKDKGETEVIICLPIKG